MLYTYAYIYTDIVIMYSVHIYITRVCISMPTMVIINITTIAYTHAQAWRHHDDILSTHPCVEFTQKLYTDLKYEHDTQDGELCAYSSYVRIGY